MFNSFLNSLLTAIVKHVSEKDMENDPEFIKYMKKLDQEILELEKEREEINKRLKNIK